MMSKALLAVVCVALGAGGTFLAVRAMAPSTPPAAVTTTPEPTPTATVEQSEGIVAPPATSPARAEAVPAPKPAAPTSRPAAPARRTDTPARTPEPAAPAAPEPPVAIAPAPITDNQASRSVEPAGPILEELVVSA